jgi:hypothetical protein
MLIKAKLLFNYRIKLFKDLYLKRFLYFLFFILSHGIFEGFHFYHLVLVFIIFLSFFFVDFISPGNNPVLDEINNFKDSDKDWNEINKKILREEKINKILKSKL